MDKIYENIKNEENKDKAKKEFLKEMTLEEVIHNVRKKSKKAEKMDIST